MAQSATMDVLPVCFCAHLANPFVFGVTLIVSAGKRRRSSIDYKTHYYANHRAFFILFGLFTPVDIVDSLLKGVPHFLALGPAYFASGVLYFAGLMTAAITRNSATTSSTRSFFSFKPSPSAFWFSRRSCRWAAFQRNALQFSDQLNKFCRASVSDAETS